MINFEKALEIARKEKKKRDAEFLKDGLEIVLEDSCIDCGDFYNFGYLTTNRKTGENIVWYGGDPAINISKKDGKILKEQWYFPGSDYWSAIHNGQKIPIPEEYRS